MQLSQVKLSFTEDNFKRIYGDIKLEDYLIDITPPQFSEIKPNVKLFYQAIQQFIMFGGITPKVFYKKFLNGEDYEDFFEWFRKDVKQNYLENLGEYLSHKDYYDFRERNNSFFNK